MRLAAILAALALSAQAQEWPGWRGPKRDGTSEEKGFPLTWGPAENVAWKVPVKGKGHSSPLVWGDRVYLTTCVEETGDRLLLCYDAKDGKLVWERTVLTYPAQNKDKHNLNSFASSTPVTDGKRLWIAFLDGKRFRAFCYGVDGGKVWEAEPGEFHSKHGFCSSPLLYKDRVIFNGDQDALAWIVALDQATGKEVWRADRPNRTRSYVPPVIFEAGGRTQMVLSGSKCVASYDPETGKQIWIIDGPTEQFVASMVYTEGVFCITGGFPDHYTLGIKPDGQGNVTSSHILWTDREGVAYVPSPIAWGPHFYVVTDEGVAYGFDAKTGKRLWKEKLGRHHSASPVAADGHLYFTDDSGITHVLKAGAQVHPVAKNELGENCYASPALSRGRLYFRTVKHLVCIGR
jgi:hypothetical protein